MTTGHASHAGTGRPPAARMLPLYVRGVVAAGAIAIAWSAPSLGRMPHPLVWALFAGLALATGTFTLKIASVGATFSVTDTFLIASAMLFGPAPATITVALNTAMMSYRKKHSWMRIAFNTAAPALSMWAAAHVFFALTAAEPLAVASVPIASLVLPLVALIAAYFLLNSGLAAIAIGLDSRQSPLRIWRSHFLWLSLSYVAAGSVSFCLISLIQQVGLGAMGMILPLLIVFHLTLRSSFGRLEDAHRHLSDMDRLYLSTIETLAMAIDAKDDVTHSHVRRVQAYALGLAGALDITDESSIKAIKAAALLHDTGKLAVPEHILNKPGGLTPAEFEKMKLHVDVGADILSLVDFPYPVVPIVRGHHENWDGSGYPRGLKGEAIPIGARILSVVDCYDALTSDRPYRPALTDEAALDILRARRGTMYDPRIVDAFIAIHLDIEVGQVSPARQHKVLDQISQAQAAPPAPAPVTGPPRASDDVLAFVSLARLASGDAAPADVLALASKLIRDVVPGVTAAWYVLEPAQDRLTVVESAGPAAGWLRDLSVASGERLTGWVAANRRSIVNSDAALDLGARAQSAVPPLLGCLSTPLMAGDHLVGALSLYSSERTGFTEDQGRLLEVITPHVALALARAARKSAAAPDAEPSPAAAQKSLRLIASR